MSDARSEILARIARATTDIAEKDPLVDVPNDWRYGQGIAQDDVVATFVEKVIDYQATVVRVSPAEVAQAIVAGAQATDAHSLVLPNGIAKDWEQALVAAGISVRHDEPQLSHSELNETDGVLTGAAAGVADTGTIVLTHALDNDQGRRALTLVPDRHICVVRASQVVSDVPEAMQKVRPAVEQRLPLTWISGGSATSDIELSRVDGVHGPRRLYVIVVDD